MLLKALASEGYATPTPIQAQAIPYVLGGRDLLGVAQTGTGKTAAFALPILQHLANHPGVARPRSCRALILSPTRELASQIEQSFRTYGRFLRLTSQVIFGGVPVGKQIRACAQGTDVIVATPGRLLDLINQRALTIGDIEMFVLDEADQMLDMGFIHDIRKLVGMLPKKRQTLFFSATMPKEMADIAARILTNPAQVSVTPAATTVDRIEQSVIFTDTKMKQTLLHRLLEDKSITRALVFSRTKHGADRVVRNLAAHGIVADAIHGNKSQGQRERALLAFRNGQSRLLVATDIAARGIDIDGVSHVINYDLPNVPESYVHRIGRTARAGADGIAISFCDREERAYLRDIERLTRQRVPVMENPLGPEVAMLKEAPKAPSTETRGPQRNGRNSRAGAPAQRPAGNAPRRDGDYRDQDNRSQDNRAPRQGEPKRNAHAPRAGEPHGQQRFSAPASPANFNGDNRPQRRDGQRNSFRGPR